MKTKHILSILVLLISMTSSCQSTKSIGFKSIEAELIDFLIQKGDIMKHQVNDFKNKKYTIRVTGVLNHYSKDNLINGIYVLSTGFTHTRVHYLIIEDDKYIILDLSNRNNLDISIKNTLDFCERQKYCWEITADYISRLIGVFYEKSRNPLSAGDVNCERVTKEVKELP